MLGKKGKGITFCNLPSWKAYSIVFYAGAQMGAPSVVNMPYSVAPGATVDITVNMAAPTTPGHYRGYWMIRNASSSRV
jgi:hypothetical protein